MSFSVFLLSVICWYFHDQKGEKEKILVMTSDIETSEPVLTVKFEPYVFSGGNIDDSDMLNAR